MIAVFRNHAPPEGRGCVLTPWSALAPRKTVADNAPAPDKAGDAAKVWGMAAVPRGTSVHIALFTDPVEPDKTPGHCGRRLTSTARLGAQASHLLEQTGDTPGVAKACGGV